MRAAFPEDGSAVPFDVPATGLAGAHFAVVNQWLEARQQAQPEELAPTQHRLLRAAARDALGIGASQSRGAAAEPA